MGEKSKDFIVMGEASESDEETDSQAEMEPKKLEDAVIAGEASESDSEDYFDMTSKAFASRARSRNHPPTPKYNSLLHKKLRESNWKLKEHLKELCFQSLRNVGSCVSEVNQELLSSQILLQEAVSVMRHSVASSTNLGSALTSLVAHGLRAIPEFELPAAGGVLRPLAQS